MNKIYMSNTCHIYSQMKARSDILRMSDGAVEGGQNQKKNTSIGHPNRISGCPEDIKKMYSTSDPDPVSFKDT
ncbi:hypothetical protein OUZ56_011922 [Daphnia magna]|uniref:Uncharacterized protein n=1 Tax=Daphnia magna TaxID=35525 RepID=A0ABQ9Z1J3_9CRUS|nr:hypothetical protein OUZ56_011922 [Daphnia magna]